MPTYEYRCEDCGKTFETIEHVEEHDTGQPACPDCGSDSTTQVLGTFFAKTATKS